MAIQLIREYRECASLDGGSIKRIRFEESYRSGSDSECSIESRYRKLGAIMIRRKKASLGLIALVSTVLGSSCEAGDTLEHTAAERALASAGSNELAALDVPESGLGFLAPRHTADDDCSTASCADVFTPCSLAVNSGSVALVEIGAVAGPFRAESCEEDAYSAPYWRVNISKGSTIAGPDLQTIELKYLQRGVEMGLQSGDQALVSVRESGDDMFLVSYVRRATDFGSGDQLLAFPSGASELAESFERLEAAFGEHCPGESAYAMSDEQFYNWAHFRSCKSGSSPREGTDENEEPIYPDGVAVDDAR